MATLGRVGTTHLLAAGEAVSAGDVEAAEYDVVVDALVGYGLTDALQGRAAALVGRLGGSTPVVSLDVPSGVNATTGEALGSAVSPARTLTLALPKTELSPESAGDLLLADIGIPAGVYGRAGIEYSQPFGGRGA